VLWAALVFVPAARAQQADSVRQVQVEAATFAGELAPRPDGTSERVERLGGGVTVRQGPTTLTSRRATRFLDRNLIVFEGDVRVVERGDTLRSDRLRYDTSDKTGEAEGSVRLTDGEVVVTAPSGRYDTRAKRSRFESGVRLVDSTAVLTARAGTYDSDARRAVFVDSVRLADGLSRVAADTLVYLRELRQSDARGGVVVRRYEPAGPVDSAFVAGDRALAGEPLPDTLGALTWLWAEQVATDEEAGTVQGRGSPLLVRITSPTSAFQPSANPPRLDAPNADPPDTGTPDADAADPDASNSDAAVGRLGADVAASGAALSDRDGPSDADTLVVRAERLDLADGDTLQTLRAAGDVRVWTQGYAARSDSASTRRTPAMDAAPARETVDLLLDPTAWFDDAQLDGDTLRFWTSDGALDSLRAQGSAFVAQPDSASERLHQLSAPLVRLHVLSDSVYRVDAFPQARTIRWLTSDDGQPDGAVEAAGDRVTIRTQGGQPDHIRMVAVEGTQYAEHLVPPGLALEGLDWQPQRRPTQAALIGTPSGPLDPRSALPLADLPPRPTPSGPTLPDPVLPSDSLDVALPPEPASDSTRISPPAPDSLQASPLLDTVPADSSTSTQPDPVQSGTVRTSAATARPARNAPHHAEPTDGAARDLRVRPARRPPPDLPRSRSPLADA
jgi:lipopolysaccharide export system protein LptA